MRKWQHGQSCHPPFQQSRHYRYETSRIIYFFLVNSISHHWFCEQSFFLTPPPDTIEKEMRSLFDIPSEKDTRLWNKYMSNTYEQLNKLDSTVQDAGLFQGQVNHHAAFHSSCGWFETLDWHFMSSHHQSHLTPQVLVIEKKNEDGTWPRQTCHSKYVHAVCHFHTLATVINMGA